jgi:hypothetical protein
MGTFHDALARSHGAVARVHGQAASWIPAGGSLTPVILLPGMAAPVETDVLGMPIRTDRPQWRILAPHAIAEGDQIILPAGHAQAGTWRVSGEPVRGGDRDPNAQFIHIELVPG